MTRRVPILVQSSCPLLLSSPVVQSCSKIYEMSPCLSSVNFFIQTKKYLTTKIFISWNTLLIQLNYLQIWPEPLILHISLVFTFVYITHLGYIHYMLVFMFPSIYILYKKNIYFPVVICINTMQSIFKNISVSVWGCIIDGIIIVFKVTKRFYFYSILYITFWML